MELALSQRWSLRDFGSLQLLWDSLSGEYIPVYGLGAVLDGGPWGLDVSSGSAELVQIDGEGTDVRRFNPEELASVNVRTSEDGQIMIADKREVVGATSLPLREWLHSCRCQGDDRALVIQIQGYVAFECVYRWEAVPQLCGDKPVCLWMDFKRLVSFVLGKNAVDRTFKYVEYLRGHLDKLGLDKSHVTYSA